MTDLASLVLAVDSTQVKTGVASLDGLTAAGARAEAATIGLGRGSKTAGAAAAAMAASAQASSRAAVGMAGGANTASLAMASLGTKTHASSLQIRESLVLMREASVGNFTRMAGSASLLAGSLATTQTSVGSLVKSLLTKIGVLKVTQDAELAEAATQAAASAASVEAYAQRVAGAIAAADTELALAEAAVRVATTSEAEAAAQLQLAAAHEAVAAAAGQAEIAENALAVAQGRAAAASEASAGATVTRLGTLGTALVGVGLGVAVLYGGFKTLQSQVSNDHTLDDYARSLGLSKKEMKELRQEVGGFTSKEMRDLETRAKAFQITWGDVWHGLSKTASDALDLSPGWQRFKQGTADAFKSALALAESAAAHMYGYWVGSYRTIVQTFSNLPSALASAFISAVNSAISEINRLIKASVDGINGFIDQANKLPLVNLGHLAAPQISEIKNNYGKAGKEAGKSFGENVAQATAEAQAHIAAQTKTIYDNIIGAAEKRIKSAADAIIEDRTPKKAKKVSDHGLAEALAELDAQIEGQNRLAAAYQVSDAAAIKAEALQKAEEQAIRHKGEIGIFYEKELALAIAQGAAEGAKRIADLRYEADSRATVNNQVAAGLIPAAQANQALQLENERRRLTALAADAEGKAKADLLDVIRNLTSAYENNNAEIARGEVLAATASGADQLDKLRAEAQLIGETNLVRATTIAQLEAEQFLRAHPGASPEEEDAYITRQVRIAQQTANNVTAQDNYNASLTAALDMLKLIEEQSQSLGQIMSDAFGQAGNAIGGIVNSLATWQAQQEQINLDASEARKRAGNDAVALANIEAQAAQKSKNAQLQAIGGVLGGLKSLFKEHSAGYKAMEAAEKAFAIIQLISTVKSIAAGAAKMFSQLGVFAFPAIAAMVAVMAGLGFSGGSSTQKAPDIPTSGEGTILGDSSAKSQSISNSLDLMAKNSTKGLDYSSAMVSSLRKIESGIGNLASAIARQLQLSGGSFDTKGFGLGTTKSGSGLSILGGVIGSLLFGSKTITKTLFDQGIQFNPATIQQIITQGISGATYNVIETITKKSGALFGLIGGGTKTKYNTVTGPLDSDIARQTQLIIGDLYKSVVDAAKVLGLDVGEALKTFKVEIGKVSFKDLKGDEITKALDAVFSKVADQMAGFAVSGLEQFQKAGEGLFETLMRLAKDYLTVDTALKSIGLTFGSVGVQSVTAREALIDLMGGLDQFVSQINFYYEHFLTAAEQTAFLRSQIDAAFGRLGLAEPATVAQFKALVTGLDLTTDAGQTAFAALMQIAPAFYQVVTAVDAVEKQRSQLQIQLLTAEGDAAGALALQRQAELAAMDESLRGLQLQIYAAQDLSKAKDNLLSAYKRESQALQTTIDKFTGFAKSLKEFRASLFAAGDAQTSYNAALAKLISIGSLASAGDENALSGLQDASQKFLDVATQNAGSLQDVERARALVARYLDQAIGGAEGQASLAQQQLDQMKDQVSALVSIDDHILTVAEAIQQLNALLTAPSSSASPAAAFSAPQGDKRAQERQQATLESIQAAVEQNTVSSNKVARILDRADRGGALAVYTDADTPIQTQVVV